MKGRGGKPAPPHFFSEVESKGKLGSGDELVKELFLQTQLYIWHNAENQ